MSKILILGASGYVGKHVAHRLIQSGQHTVYGVARSPERAAQLARQEIILVLCSNPVEDPEPYLSVVRSENIDIVVDASGANQDSYSLLHNVMLIGQERQKEYGRHGVKGPKLGFIYYSGTWVHGSSSQAVNDLSVADLAPSSAQELKTNDLVVFRDSASHRSEEWEKESIEIPLDTDARPGLVHVDDVARAFQCAITKLPCLSGTGVYPVFDLVTSQEGMREIFESMAVCWGFKGTVRLKGAGGDKLAKAMSTTFRGSSARAEQLLGWRPRRLGGFVKDMNVHAAAFAGSETHWSCDRVKNSTWIKCSNAINVSQAVMNLYSFRTEVPSPDQRGQGDISGSTPTSLGYVTLDLDATVGQSLTVTLRDGDLGIIEPGIYTTQRLLI